MDSEAPVPLGIQAWNNSDPSRRFAVYRNNVVVSLVDALAETFPVVQELVGIEFFRAAAALFARQLPPSSPILALYGRDFASFIETFEPAWSVPYLADVARLEFTRVAAYHAADATPLTALDQELVGASGATLSALRFNFHPSARLVRSKFAVASLWAAHNGTGLLESIDIDTPEDTLVCRVDLEVELVRLAPGGGEFVEALMSGHPLGAAAEYALESHNDFNLSLALSTLVRQQAVTLIQLSRQEAT
ncbi:DNA-binding domain-containing protein [Ralstonia pickettii]|nr:DNA-binding domain-containing protein [Ralstonia pickettii]